MKTLTLIFLSILLFFGNIGIPVFTHACEKDGIFTSFFINQQSHCQEEVSDLPPCCQKEKKKNCCHDEKTVVKLDGKYVQSQALSVPTFIFICPVQSFKYYFRSFPKSKSAVVQTWEDPPPIRESGRDILIQHCVYRI